MQHHGGHSFKVRPGDPLDVRHVFDRAVAFVMDDDVVSLGPIGLGIDAHAVRAVFPLVDDGPLDIGPGAHPFGNNLLLGFVIMATAAGDHERANRLRPLGTRRETADQHSAEHERTSQDASGDEGAIHGAMSWKTSVRKYGRRSPTNDAEASIILGGRRETKHVCRDAQQSAK